jgi:opacity protein-like surface antigen
MPGKAVILGAVATAALLVGAGGASAQGFYLKGFGGWTIPQNNDFQLNDRTFDTSSGSGLDYDSGYVLGAAAGYDVNPNVALELEYAYRNSDATLKNTGGASGEVQSNAFMANAIYKFDGIGPNGAFKPYVGAGLGVADQKFDPDGFGSLDGDYNFAYQLITGVAYDLTPSWTLNGEVRYFGITDQTVENDDYGFKNSYSTFDAIVGATYHF